MLNSSAESDLLHQKNKDRARKLIRIRSVINVTGLSKSYIYDLSNRGLFPKSIQLVPGGTSVAWIESEILAWIDSRIQSRDSEKLAQTNQ
jgi:prophage regulatory protein